MMYVLPGQGMEEICWVGVPVGFSVAVAILLGADDGVMIVVLSNDDSDMLFVGSLVLLNSKA